jgi:Putative MetA-pathway of phenol degradation
LSFAILLLAAAAANPPICTDRPTKANVVCTVPVDRFQLESSAIGWVETKAGGVRTEVLSVASSFVKYGLSDRSDLQIGFTPYVRIKTKEAGESSSISGFGDVIVRYKHRLTADEDPVQVALIPLVKLPTAKRGIGNRKVEGGLAAPISFALAGPVTATLGPEVDLLADGDGHGRHLALVNLINLSAPIAPRLTLAGELWSNFNFDPDGTIEQASADAALAYAASNNVQLDVGANLGLTRDTPDLEAYAGVSVRF